MSTNLHCKHVNSQVATTKTCSSNLVTMEIVYLVVSEESIEFPHSNHEPRVNIIRRAIIQEILPLILLNKNGE